MIMPKEKREIQKNDIMPLDIYTKQRKQLRKNIVEFKKNRRISLGPYATFYFENYETMLAQVHEMLYIEKGGDDQLNDELTAYNPLIPNGGFARILSNFLVIGTRILSPLSSFSNICPDEINIFETAS